MVVSMVKLKWILQLCRKCFYSGPMTLECRDTKFWLVLDALITMSEKIAQSLVFPHSRTKKRVQHEQQLQQA